MTSGRGPRRARRPQGPTHGQRGSAPSVPEVDAEADNSVEAEGDGGVDSAAAPDATSRASQEAALTQTRDDLDLGWGETPPSPSGHDAWLQAQRPPHWE